MQVLISGGIKTINVLKAVESRFSSGIQFTIENNIANIASYFARGNYFDRAIILEQSWTEDGAIKDELKIRENLHQFITAVRERQRNFEIIFVVSSTSDMAKLVLEESLDILAYSVVLFKQPPYFASFFTSLVANDINKMPERFVFDMRKAADDSHKEDLNKTVEWSDDSRENDNNSGMTGQLLESIKEVSLDNDIKDLDDIPESDLDGDISQKMFGEEGEGTNFSSNFEENLKEIEQSEIDEVDPMYDTGLNTDDDSTDQIDDIPLDTYDRDDYLSNGESPDEVTGLDFDSVDDLDDLFDSGLSAVEQNDTDYSNMSDDISSIENALDNIENTKDDDYDELGNAEADSYGSANSGLSGYFDNFEKDVEVGGESADIEYIPNDASQESIIDQLFDNKDQLDAGLGTYGVSDKTSEIASVERKEVERGAETSNDAGKLFNDSFYKESEESEKDTDEVPIDFGIDFKAVKGKLKIKSKSKTIKTPDTKQDYSDLITVLNTFLKRGNALTVTGCRCSGKTLVASNIANAIAKQGYTVLLVDMDTKWRGLSYITKDIYETVHEGDTSKAALRKAVNSNSSEIGRHVDIIRPGFHVLTTGLGCDMESVGEIIQSNKLNRFIHNAKSTYNFIVFDVQFEDLVTSLSDLLFATDDLIMCVDATNHGLMEFLLNMGNIDSEDVKSTLFNIAQILFNKVEKVEQVFGYKVNTVRQILKALDNQMAELIGGEAEYLFSDMKVCGVMKYNQLYEKYWFSRHQITDYVDGEKIFLDILRKVLVKN